jgi:hypothetical protein
MTAPAKKKSSSAARVAAYRKRMREAGLVPRTIWVPDTKDPKFIEEYRRQCRAVSKHEEREREIMEWVERAYEGHDLGPIPEYRPPEKK